MKILLIILSFLPAVCIAQKYAIVDPELKAPILYADTVGISHLEKGFIPMDALKVDSIITFLEGIAVRMEKVKYNKFYSMEWTAGLTSINVTMDRQAYGDKYNVIVYTKSGNNPEYGIPIITNWEANGDTRRYLKKFIDFVRANRK
jgi:hypothetical protein